MAKILTNVIPIKPKTLKFTQKSSEKLYAIYMLSVAIPAVIATHIKFNLSHNGSGTVIFLSVSFAFSKIAVSAFFTKFLLSM